MTFTRTNHPQINAVLEKFELETIPFIKIHRMIDLFETIIKTHTAYIIADYLRINQLSEPMKGLLANGLMKPSLGMWQFISRELVRDLIIPKQLSETDYEEVCYQLQKGQASHIQNAYEWIDGIYRLKKQLPAKQLKKIQDYFLNIKLDKQPKPFFENYYSLFKSFDKLISSSQKSQDGHVLKDIIAFRNYYAHGATPNGKDCELHLIQYAPLLETLLSHPFLQQTELVVVNERHKQISFDLVTPLKVEDSVLQSLTPNMPYIMNEYHQCMALSPILFFKKVEEKPTHFFFFNDLKRLDYKELSLLEYPNSYHLSDVESYRQFIELIQVEKWSANFTDEFKVIVDQLSEHFYGRTETIQQVMRYIQSVNTGTQFIYGEPGIGKSAVMAKVFNELRFEQEKLENQKIFYIDYFIKRNTLYSDPYYFLNTILEKLELLFPELSKREAISLDDKSKKLQDYLLVLSKQKDSKIVFLIDGLDEGIEQQLLRYIPMVQYENIIYIYASRPHAKILELEQNVKHKAPIIILDKLEESDIRALLYNIINKYELFRMNQETEKIILQKSDGNPLYLKLLCEELAQNKLSLATIHQIPEKLNGFYDELFSTFAKHPEAELLFKSLYVLLAAKDYISSNVIAKVIDPSSSTIIFKINDVLSYMRTILVESPINKGTYRIFHESIRDYIQQNDTDLLQTAALRLIAFCEKWPLYSSKSEEYSYSVRFLFDHLMEQNAYQKLLLIIQDLRFIDGQIEVTKQFDLSFYCCEQIQQISRTAPKELQMSILEEMLFTYQYIQTKLRNLKQIDYYYKQYAIEDWLQNIRYFNDFEKAYAYLYLINMCLEQPQFRKHLAEILDHFKLFAQDVDLAFEVPAQWTVKTAAKLCKLGFNYMTLLENCNIEFDYDKNNLVFVYNLIFDQLSFEEDIPIVLYEYLVLHNKLDVKAAKKILELTPLENRIKLLNKMKNADWLPKYIIIEGFLSIGNVNLAEEILETVDKDIERNIGLLMVVHYKKVNFHIDEWPQLRESKMNQELLKEYSEWSVFDEWPHGLQLIEPLCAQDYEYFTRIQQTRILQKMRGSKLIEDVSNFISYLIDINKFDQVAQLFNEAENWYGFSETFAIVNLYENIHKSAKPQIIHKLVNKRIILQNEKSDEKVIPALLKQSIVFGDKDITESILKKWSNADFSFKILASQIEGYGLLLDDRAIELAFQFKERTHPMKKAINYLITNNRIEECIKLVETAPEEIRETLYHEMALNAYLVKDKSVIRKLFTLMTSFDMKINLILMLSNLEEDVFVGLKKHIAQYATILRTFSTTEDNELAIAKYEFQLLSGSHENYSVEEFIGIVKKFIFGIDQNVVFRIQFTHLLNQHRFKEAEEILNYLGNLNEATYTLRLILIKEMIATSLPVLDHIRLLICDEEKEVKERVADLIQLAKMLQEKGDLKQAKNVLVIAEQFITKQEQPDLYLSVSMQFHSMGAEKEAKRLYRRCIKNMPHPLLEVFKATKELGLQQEFYRKWKDESLEQGIYYADKFTSEDTLIETVITSYKKSNWEDAKRNIEECIKSWKEKFKTFSSGMQQLPTEDLVMEVSEEEKEWQEIEFLSEELYALLEHLLPDTITSSHWQFLVQLYGEDVLIHLFENDVKLEHLKVNVYIAAIQSFDRLPTKFTQQLAHKLIPHVLKIIYQDLTLLPILLSNMPLNGVNVEKILTLYSVFADYDGNQELHHRIVNTLNGEFNLVRKNSSPVFMIRDALEKLERHELTLDQFKYLVSQL